MKEIWKYKLGVTDFQLIGIPKGGEILSVQVQNGIPCIWVVINPNEKILEVRKLMTVGTGHPMQITKPQEREFIGTYQLENGSPVFHLFEIK